jgi:hypothetical protein
MKAKVEWMVLCERLLHDSLTGQISLIACLREVGAVDFPSEQPGFAFVAQLASESVENEAKPLEVRLWRLSKVDGDEVVFRQEMEWSAGSRTCQVGSSFQVLRLRQPEVLGFRLDWRMASAAWHKGPVVTLEVRQQVSL